MATKTRNLNSMLEAPLNTASSKVVSIIPDKQQDSPQITDKELEDLTNSYNLQTMTSHPENGFVITSDLAIRLAPSWGARATILALLAIEYGNRLFNGSEIDLDVEEFSLRYDLHVSDIMKALSSIRGVNLNCKQLTLPLTFELKGFNEKKAK